MRKIVILYIKKIRLKQKDNLVKQYTADIIVEVINREKQVVPIRDLCDTGTSGTIILKDKVQKGRAKSAPLRRTQWRTHGGVFTTRQQSLVEFKLPEFSQDKKVTWICHIDDKTNPKQAQYDMILGMDLMIAIGLTADCESRTIKWEGMEIPLKEKDQLMNKEMLEHLYTTTGEPSILQEAEERQSKILAADYSKVEVGPYVQGLPHLSPPEKIY